MIKGRKQWLACSTTVQAWSARFVCWDRWDSRVCWHAQGRHAAPLVHLVPQTATGRSSRHRGSRAQAHKALHTDCHGTDRMMLPATAVPGGTSAGQIDTAQPCDCRIETRRLSGVASQWAVGGPRCAKHQSWAGCGQVNDLGRIETELSCDR
jgi:hypothetical protein